MNALVGIPALLGEFGVKLHDALEGIAIDPRAFDDQDYRIPYSLGGRLLERCAHSPVVPTLGCCSALDTIIELSDFPGIHGQLAQSGRRADRLR